MKSTETLTYWSISLAFCGAWLWASHVVLQMKWYRVQPGMCAWIILSTIQSISCSLAGRNPNHYWTLYVWVSVEVLVLETAFLTAVEALWSKLWIAGAALPGTVAFLVFCKDLLPGNIAVNAHWINLPPLWYLWFLAFREWFWIVIAMSMVIHLIWLFVRVGKVPRSLEKPGVFRARCLFTVYAILIASSGIRFPLGMWAWLLQRYTYRILTILVLVGLARLRRPMSLCLEGAMVRQGQILPLDHPHL